MRDDPSAFNQHNDSHVGQTLLAMLWRHRLVFVVAFALIYGLVLAALVLLPKTYVATGSVIVAEPETGLGSQEGIRSINVGDPADVESQLLVISSDRILKMVAAAPGVIEIIRNECATSGSASDCAGLTPDSDSTVVYLSKHYSIAGVGRSRVINIAYKSNSPQIARDMANALITQYLEEHRDSLVSGKSIAAEEIQRQLDQLDQDIRMLDGRIQAFREKNGLVRGSLAPANTELLSSLLQQLATAQADRSQAESALKEVEADLKNDLPTSQIILQSPAVKAIHSRMLALEVQVEVASSSLGPRHPQNLALRSELASLKARLKAESHNYINGVKKQLATAQDRVSNLQTLVDNAEANVSKASAGETEIAPLVTGVEVKRKEYADLSAKLKSLETEQQSTLGSTRLVSLASLPIKPVFPKTLPFLVGGIILAALGAAASAFAVEFLSSLGTGRTDRPTYGGFARQETAFAYKRPSKVAAREPPHRAPHFKPRRKAAPSWSFGVLPAWDEPLSEEQAIYLTDVLNIVGPSSDNAHVTGAKSVVIAPLTSMSQNGSLTLATHLARLAASFGVRTLIVEIEFEKPKFAATLGLDPQFKLNDLLNTEGRHSQYCLYDIATPVDDFDVIFADPGQADFDDPYLQERLSNVLARTGGYDLVILACPQVGHGTLASAVASEADGIIFCDQVSDGKVRLSPEVKKQIDEWGLNHIGTALMEKSHFIKIKNARRGSPVKKKERWSQSSDRVARRISL